MKTLAGKLKYAGLGLAAMAMTLFVLGFSGIGSALAASNASTAMTIAPNPAPLVSGPDITINTTTTSSVVTTTVIDGGKVTIEYATDGGSPASPVPAGSAIAWLAVPGATNISPSAGATSSQIDLDALGFIPGMTGGFRAHYITGGGSPKADTHFSGAIDVTASAASCSGLTVAADLVGGNGTPAPGDSGPWTFGIVVTNCTGVDLSNVKVQGGSNGWAPMTDTSDNDNVAVRTNKKNQVLTWTVSILNGETKTLNVEVDGTIPASALCSIDPNAPDEGTVRFLSGAWSAVYDDGSGPQKSDYTGRVSIVVTCPTP